MKRLYLVRHAKSDWTYEGLPDIDRPLSERGYRDAHLMSKHLLGKKHQPDGIVSSPAIRAINTALIFARNMNFPENKIQLNSLLYNSTAETYIAQLSGLHDELKNVFVFGHNPTISKVVTILTDSEDKAMPDGRQEMPTCCIACIEFKGNSWKATDSVSLLWMESPKSHP